MSLENKRYWCQIITEELGWNYVKKSGFVCLVSALV